MFRSDHENHEIARWHGVGRTIVLGRDRGGGLELRLPGDRSGTGVGAAVDDVLRRPLDARHPLRRIVRGLPTDGGAATAPIIDATAGLGGDAAVASLAAPSRTVLACERHPLIGAVLEDGVGRARSVGHEPATRIRVLPLDARSILRWFANSEPGTGERRRLTPALVILDPMFPERRRSSALPPKPMQRLRDLAETPTLEDADRETAELLRLAEASGAVRIALKRPPEAATPVEVLGKPTFEIETRLVRWAVWERGG
jgi:16S rRNA (guanine1516-N2)-methyltransferase